jgi:hypothetical protein
VASHKTLKSVVTSFAQSFTSLMNYGGDDYVMGHIVYAAWSTGSTGFRLDLLSGATDSSPLLVPEVRDSVAQCVRRFPEMVRRSNSSMDFVKEAELAIAVDPTIRRPCGHLGFFEPPFTCSVRITDDRGKVYFHVIRDWWWPEKVPPRREKRQWWRFW